MQYIYKEEDLQKVLNYLVNQPYNQVVELIQIIQKGEEYKEKIDKNK